jgi:hypothetical protein
MTPERAAPLIARGAIVDIFAAAHLGMFDRVKELVEADPSQVRARGGDGRTALHCAKTVEIAEYLLARGADIDARDVDHESTPAQYLVREAPEVARMLVERGAWFDIFIAVALNDPALVERSLRADPEALDHRIWHGKYTTVHRNGRASTREEIGAHRGDIYRWVFDHNASALDVAAKVASPEIYAILWQHATPAQRLLAACARGDRHTATDVIAEHPDVVSSLTLDQRKLIVDRAHANDAAAVLLMVDLGFDSLVKGVDDWEAIRWGAFHGNVEMVARLLQHSPPINVPDPSYGGTILAQCLYGSLHGWHCRDGQFAATAKLLLDAGEMPKPDWHSIGRDDVDAVLKAWFDTHPRT